MNPDPLLGKAAVVTGGARWIGYAIARRLSVEGADVVIADINEGLARASANRIADETGRRALAIGCEVAEHSSVYKVVEYAVSELGSLDIMVANAGIYPASEFLKLDDATWRRTIDVNLTGAFYSGQAAASAMIQSGGGGRIIFITSVCTLSAISDLSHYAASKSGVRMLMGCMAVELGKHNITVNAVAPGDVGTEEGRKVPRKELPNAHLYPLGRLGEPEDIAGAVVFLASDDASYITGTTIRVDGGRVPVG